MLVKLLVSRVGDNFSQIRGDELEIESDEACRMIDAQQAVPVSEEAKADYAEYKNAKPQPPKAKPKPEVDPEDNSDGDKTPDGEGEESLDGPTVDEIGLKEKHAKVLRDNGITTLAQLQDAGDLTQLDGIGKPTAQEIRDSVAAYLARQ